MNANAETATETQDTPRFCHKYVDDEGVIHFDFGDGESLTIDPENEIPDETRWNLMNHGILQKGGDSYAGAGGDFAYAREQLSKVLDNLRNGLFKAPRGTGTGKPKTGELVAALAEIKGLDATAASALVEAMSEEKRKAVRNHPVVKAKVAELRARKANEALAKAANVAALDV